MDEGLPSDDVVIAPAPSRPVQDREQVRHLACDLTWPGGPVVVQRLVHPASHRQTEPRRHSQRQGQTREEIESLHRCVVEDSRRAEARIGGVKTKPQAARQGGRELTEVHAWQSTELLGYAVRWETPIQGAFYRDPAVGVQFGQGAKRGGTYGRFL